MTVARVDPESDTTQFVWLLFVLLAGMALFSWGEAVAAWALGLCPMLIGALWLRAVVVGEAPEGARVRLAATGIAVAMAAALGSAVWARAPVVGHREALGHVVLAIGAAAVPTVLAAQVGRVVGAIGAARIQRVTHVLAWLALPIAVLGAAGPGAAGLGARAPTPAAQLAAIAPATRVEVGAGAVEQWMSVQIEDDAFLHHVCRAQRCWGVRPSRDARISDPWPRGASLDAPGGTIAVARLGDLWLVAPGRGQRGAWAEGVAWRERDGRFELARVRPHDLTSAPGVPTPWHAQPMVACVLALFSLLAAQRARRSAHALASAREGAADDAGTIHLEDGTLVRDPDASIGSGPVLVGELSEPVAAYRRSPIGRARHVRPGTRAEWTERAIERAVALEIGALTLLLAGWAPLLAAWQADFALFR